MIKTLSHIHTRMLAALAVAIVAIGVLFTAIAYASEGQPKQEICHKGQKEIVVADPAIVQAHLDHGDTIGACDGGGDPDPV